MHYCIQCHRELDPVADICPHCQAARQIQTAIPAPQKPVVPLRGRLATLVSLASSLAVLVGFFLPWFQPFHLLYDMNTATVEALETRIPLSGLALTQQQFLAHEFYSPQTLPGDFALLWLLPLAALLLLGAEYTRGLREHTFRRLRFWALLSACASMSSLIHLFFLLDRLQFSQYLNMEYGFWLTCGGLILATLLLLRRLNYKRYFQYIPTYDEVPRGRRAILSTGLNLLAMLGTGAAATSFFLAEQRNYARMQSARAVFSTGTYSDFYPGKILAWSPDSKYLLARTAPLYYDGNTWDGGLPQPPIPPLIRWQQGGGIQLAMLNIRDMNAQAWSPDGRFLAMTINGKAEVYCWDTKNWAVFHSYAVEGAGPLKLSGLAWSPDSQRVAAGVYWADPQGNALYIWETTSGKQLAAYILPFLMNTAVYNVAWSPDGSALAASGLADHANSPDTSQGFVVVWDVATGRVRFQHISQVRDQNIVALAWSPNSRLLAFADGTSSDGIFEQIIPGVPVQVWDVAANRLIRNYSGHILGITCLGWSPNGKRLAAGGDDGTVQVWDNTNGERLLIYQGHQGDFKVVDLAWSPDGAVIASTTQSDVRIWDAP